MGTNIYLQDPDDGEFIFTRYITRNGKRIYHPTGGVYRIPVKRN